MAALTSGIDHLGLSVTNLDETSEFFIDCLGWRQFGGNENYPAKYVTDGHSKLTLWQITSDGIAEFDRKNNVGLHHLALKVSSEDALKKIFDIVSVWQNVNVEFAPEFSGNGPKIHFMINEPSGTRIEFAFDPR